MTAKKKTSPKKVSKPAAPARKQRVVLMAKPYRKPVPRGH